MKYFIATLWKRAQGLISGILMCRDPVTINKIFNRVTAGLAQTLLVHGDSALRLRIKGIHDQIFASTAEITDGQNKCEHRAPPLLSPD